jgi:hypothetical protein
MLHDKQFLGLLSLAIGLIGYLPYLYGLYRGKLRPHIFTWFLWGLLMVIAFAGQISGDGGIGTWVTGFSAFMCFFISAIAFSHGENDITRSDWITFGAGLTTIPLWLVTKNPFWSMLVIIVIEFFATWPTARKSWMKPQQESPTTYFLAGVKFIPSILAMQKFNLITLGYPVALVLINLGLVSLLLCRRYILDGRLNWN